MRAMGAGRWGNMRKRLGQIFLDCCLEVSAMVGVIAMVIIMMLAIAGKF